MLISILEMLSQLCDAIGKAISINDQEAYRIITKATLCWIVAVGISIIGLLVLIVYIADFFDGYSTCRLARTEYKLEKIEEKIEELKQHGE